MENEFVNYTQALALKELGFDEPCFGYYNTNTQGKMDYKVIEGLLEWFGDDYQPHNSKLHHSMIASPLYQQAFRWFREKHKLESIVVPSGNSEGKTNGYYFEIIFDFSKDNIESDSYPSYEKAEQACLDKLIEIYKNK
jgi:hypothetical protein